MEEEKKIEPGSEDQQLNENSGTENTIVAENPLNDSNDLNDLNDTMEVHKHPHHVTHKKKWGEYLLEFLMLFLAVFLGFLAENIREHQVEKDREKIYIKNMLEDLKSDTASYKNYATNANLTLGSIDSLIYLLKSPDRDKYVNRIYFLARTFTMRNDLLFANERTYEQMKSSGHLRLIHIQEVADSISYYYNSLKQINNQNDRITERINQYFLSVSKLFDAAILLEISKNRKMPEGESAKLLTEDPLVINEVLTRAQYLYATFLFTQTQGLARCRTAQNLIVLIKKEYHPE